MRELKLLLVVLAPMLFAPGLAATTEPNLAPSLPKLMPQLGHDQRLASVAFSPTGKQVLTGGNDAAAVLWDNATGREIRRFEIDRNSVWSVAFAAKGKQVLVGSWKADLFDVQTGEILESFEPDGLVLAMAVSPDGTQLLLTATNAASLWDLRTGERLQRFEGNRSAISSVAFSPDGTQVVTGGGYHPTNETRDIKDFTVRLWNAKTGKEIQQFVGHTGAVKAVFFSPPDGRYLLSASRDESVSRLWEVATGREVGQFEGHTGNGSGAVFSPDGRYVVTSSWPITLWDVATNTKVREFKGHKQEVAAVAFSPDGKQLVSASWDKTARLWDVDTGNELMRFKGETYSLSTVAFSRDGRQILTAGSDNKAHLWDAGTGAEVQRYEGHGAGQYGYLNINAVGFSGDDRFVLTAGYDGTARLWEANTGKELQVFKGHGKDVNGYYAVGALAFSADDRLVLTGGDDGTARLWDAETGRQLQLFEGHGKAEGRYDNNARVGPVAFLLDGRVLTSGQDRTVRVWNVETGQEVRRFEGWKGEVIAFSPDGTKAMTRDDFGAGLWDLDTGRQVWRITDQPYVSAAFSSNGKQVLTVSGSNVSDKTARLWDAATGEELQRFEGHTASLSAGIFSPDGTKVLTVSKDRTTRIWDANSGQELARLLSFDDGAWAVVDSSGRFDASNGGDIQGLHWVVGLEPIKLSQLKERYYEPGLLAKVLKLNIEEGLRDVEVFNERGIELFPEVTVTHSPSPEDPILRVRLENRGGGIGKVQVLVNGKEHREDARRLGSDDQAAVLELEVDLTNSPLMIAGADNAIEVVAYNAAGYLASRPRGDPRPRAGGATPAAPPALWAVVVGVSDYRGSKIDLHYAAKDADDFANALGIAAKGHGGFKGVHIRRLTDSTTPATRKNLEAAFEWLKQAKATDILVVYLAGHGITWGGEDGDYYYLLREARSLELNDKAVREQAAVSSQVLTKWIKAVPALKQAFILDTCASGQAIVGLTASRTVSASQTRSLERMKDRTGMFVLAGSAADAVSYETTEYGQGLLTYSLLEGMKGPALGNDGFVDVQKLFSHAIDRVPQLAGDLGGIQQPRLSVPRGGESFDLGQLRAAERDRIPLSQKRPLVLRTSFQDEDKFQDRLKFGDKVNGALRELASRGRAAPLVFIDADEFSNAYLLVGRYSVRGELVKVTVSVSRENRDVETFKVQGQKSALAQLASQVAKQMQRIIGQNP